MLNYELLYLVSNQYTDGEMEEIKKKVNAMIEKNGGQIGYEEFLGKRKLAYPIKKTLHGYYQAVEFELENGDALKNINNELRLDKEVVRAQIIAKPKITATEIRKRKERVAQEIERPLMEKTAIKEKKRVSGEEAKVKIKNLDEKLEEILKEDII